MTQMFNPKLALNDQIEIAKGEGKFAFTVTDLALVPKVTAPMVYGKTAEVPFGLVQFVGTDRALVLKTASSIEIDEPTTFTAPRRFKIREIYPADDNHPLLIICLQSGV